MIDLDPDLGPIDAIPTGGGGLHPGSGGVLEAVRENVIAFALAVVMALVIKHFALEAFRIPTSSMRPTLLGKDDAGPDREEDRIVVDKWAFLLAGPERWDVAVFRYPLDLSRNFIKRVAGLGGEWLRIAEGDVWTRRSPEDPWRPAAKRRRVREQLYRRVYPGPRSAERWTPGAGGRLWEADGRSDGWRVESPTDLAFEGGEPARVRMAERLSAEGTSHAKDIRMLLRVTPSGDGTLTLGWSPEGGWRSELRLALGDDASSSGLAFRHGTEAAATHGLAARLAAGRATPIEWELVDGEAHVHVDGRELAVVPFVRQAGGDGGMQALTIEARGAPLTIHDLAVDRDLHYTQESGNRSEPFTPEGLWIPEDCYFMLGDNTTSSSDGRAWKAGGLRLADGREIWWNLSGDSGQGPRRVPGTEQERVVDLEGVERVWSEEDVADDDLPDRWVSFVPRANLVGRAFYVFWPAWPEFPRRLGWIH